MNIRFSPSGCQSKVQDWDHRPCSRAEQLPEILLKSQYVQVIYTNCRSCNFLMKVKCVTKQHIKKYCSAAMVYISCSPDVRNHVCLVQTPTIITSSLSFYSFFSENESCDAKMIIPTNDESYRNRNVCQNNRHMI